MLTRRTVSVDAVTGLRTEIVEVGFYAPFGAEYSFDVGGGLWPARLEDTYGLFDRPYTIRDRSALGGGIGYEQLSVAPGAGRSVSMWAESEVVRGASATAPFTLAKSTEGEGVRWTVTNGGAAALRGLMVVANGLYRLSDLGRVSVSFLVDDGSVTGEGVTAIVVERRPHARDYVSWEAEARLRAEWMTIGPWIEGGASGPEVAPRATPAVVKPPPFDPSSPNPVRLLAVVEEAYAGARITGLPERAKRRGVVVYQVTLDERSDVRGLVKRYGRVTALSGVDLQVDAGSIHGLVGTNGAGKTTLLRILATVLPADGGSVTLSGVDVLSCPREARSLFGFMPDFFGVYDDLTVEEYLDFFGAAYGLRPSLRAQRIPELLALTHLEGKAATDVQDLSRGMQQRLCWRGR